MEEQIQDPTTGQIVKKGAYRAEFHQGPIPDPESIAKYAAIDPTFPNRLMAMAESQLAYRQSEQHRNGERIAFENSQILKQGDRGQHYALVVVLAVLAVALVALIYGYPTTAGIIVTADIATVAGLFLYGGQGFRGRRHGKDSEAKKNESDTPEKSDHTDAN